MADTNPFMSPLEITSGAERPSTENCALLDLSTALRSIRKSRTWIALVAMVFTLAAIVFAAQVVMTSVFNDGRFGARLPSGWFEVNGMLGALCAFMAMSLSYHLRCIGVETRDAPLQALLKWSSRETLIWWAMAVTMTAIKGVLLIERVFWSW